MLFLEMGFKSFTGGMLERILGKTTDTRFKSLGFGIVSTTLMQSSSLVTILTISFLSTGLLDLAAGIGIIFGANLGTSTGAWLIAGLGLKIKIAEYALPMLVFGILFIFQNNRNLKGLGYIIAGLGFLFLGIDYMKQNFETIKATLNLADYAVPGIKGLLIYTLLGIAATGIMQSSHATMVLIITALAAQQVSYENALALAIGSNIGTTITAIIGALGSNIEGKRLAGGHLLFNLITGLIALLFIRYFEIAVDKISLAIGIADDDLTLKLAVFHTLFNTTGIILLFPFINQLVVLLQKIIPDKRSSVFKPIYLNDSAINFPETLIESVRLESIHLYDNAIHVILNTFGLHRRDLIDKDKLWEVIEQQKSLTHYDIDASYEKRIKGIFSALIDFISQAHFSREIEHTSKLFWLRGAYRSIIDAIKDTKHLQKNWLRYGSSRNTNIRLEYKKIVYQIALLIHQIETFRNHDNVDELSLLSLDTLKVQIEEDGQQMVRRIESLLWEKKIPSETGSSLINDNAYMCSIKNNLIKITETLFINQQIFADQTASQLALSESEIKQVVESEKHKTSSL